MANHLLTFLLEIEDWVQNGDRVASEIYRRIPRIRSDLVVMGTHIPAYFEQLGLSELDDIFTAVAFMATGVQMDHPCMAELDALGAALNLPGFQTRLELRVLDAIKSMGLGNRWRDYAS